VTLFVVLLNTSGADASFSRSEIATPEDRETETEGLYSLAGLTRGTVLPVTGSAEGAFQRVFRELAGYYMLGLEPDPGDRDGRSHTVKVTVGRPKVTVRARGLLTVPSVRRNPKRSSARRSARRSWSAAWPSAPPLTRCGTRPPGRCGY